MWLKWLPWRYVIKRLARAHGFMDPVQLLSQLDRFAQPSEVAVPLELLRAGVVFHARGLVNTKAIQHNLDWVWPYWVERQFNPRDVSFVPRAFSFSHVNLTHRNWTAVGIPDCNRLPLVDPRGLLTPFLDGWSLDAWIVGDDGTELLPSRCPSVAQRLDLGDDALALVTHIQEGDLVLDARVTVRANGQTPVCHARYEAQADDGGHLVLALRPYNPEGISFVHKLKIAETGREWCVNGEGRLTLSPHPDGCATSAYKDGDVRLHLDCPRPAETDTAVQDDVGMLTAAAVYDLAPQEPCRVDVAIPLNLDPDPSPVWPARSPCRGWSDALDGAAQLTVPDERVAALYDTHLRGLVLHTPRDAYAGPYTYRRFWFRDATFMLNAMLCCGLVERCERLLDTYPRRLHANGYFSSQNGEWDSNGEVLWSMARFWRLTGREPTPEWLRVARKAARWIQRKRCAHKPRTPHAGLMPAGFSAEHLGTNDFYYWDDFWSVAGLRAAAAMLAEAGDAHGAAGFRSEADDLWDCIQRSLRESAPDRERRGVPASPYRRMDAGAIGSVVQGYPLQLCPPCDPGLLATVRFLRQNCFVKGAFFQDMIHSGINAYLTMHIAQVLLRAGDPSWFDVLEAVADVASPTGQWPEAVHPQTGGGCMGDGQHLWAAADWIMLIRNMFVREEGNVLVLASGMPRAWLRANTVLRFGPTLTPCGPVSIEVEGQGQATRVSWQGDWRERCPAIQVRVPGHEVATVTGPEQEATVRRMAPTAAVPDMAGGPPIPGGSP